MKNINILRNTAIFFYMSIVLMGQIMGVPLIFWLLFTAFDLSNTDQILAVFGLLGIILNVTPWKNNIIITILSFLMMLSPVIGRFLKVPIQQFKYLAFEIPLLLFLVGYLIFIILNAKKRKRIVSL